MMGIVIEMISDYGFVLLGIVGSLIAIWFGYKSYRRRRTSRS